MAPSVNFAFAHEYARVRSPRRVSSNGWWGRCSENIVVLKKKPEDEEREEVELLLMSKACTAGVLHPRICANCRTSKTPLWRSGPTGPKSLCNACGIRFRKKQQEAAGGSNNPLTFFNPSWAVSGSPTSHHVLTLDEMKALQKAKQLRVLRFIARRRTQELRRRLLETSRREVMQAAQLLLSFSLSQGPTPTTRTPSDH